MEFIEDIEGARLRENVLHAFQGETAAVAGSESRKIERDDQKIVEGRRDRAVDDALRESADDGLLADTGRADEHGIVVSPAGEDLQDLIELSVTSDERISWPSKAAPVRFRENSARTVGSC